LALPLSEGLGSTGSAKRPVDAGQPLACTTETGTRAGWWNCCWLTRVPHLVRLEKLTINEDREREDGCRSKTLDRSWELHAGWEQQTRWFFCARVGRLAGARQCSARVRRFDSVTQRRSGCPTAAEKAVATNGINAGFVLPNVRAKGATAAGRQAQGCDNVQRTTGLGLVACRWRSA
jgi:hypothetical protein